MPKTKTPLITSQEILDLLQLQLAPEHTPPQWVSEGQITSCGDGVATASGLSQAMLGEVLKINNTIFGLVLNLRESEVGLIILGDYLSVKVSDKVTTTGKILSVPVSTSLLGGVVNALLLPVDKATKQSSPTKTVDYPVEKIAPGVIKRQDVRTPLQTGVKIIDALIPIGRGQRELIIGDRGTGKTALALDAIINQSIINRALPKGQKRVISIYVAIGQKQSKIAQVVGLLKSHHALSDTIIVNSPASDPASMQYLSAFSATALAEFFMDRGEDVLVIYDDLTKHAWAYREISLLLKRPSGREAYPGDIFYLHSRLLERSARLHDSQGGGSITALPIIETQAGDISAYIPTNVISITDGQIYLEPELFNAGSRPAVSVGLSVSRVGGDAQTKILKSVAGQLKLDLAQYRELSAFAQFGSDLDESTQKRLQKGKILTKLMKQKQFSPQDVKFQAALLWIGMGGNLDDLSEDNISLFEEKLLSLLQKEQKKITNSFDLTKELSTETQNYLLDITKQIKQSII